MDGACGVTKGCFHDCGGAGTCTFLVTWVDGGGDSVDFTIQGKVKSSGNQWIAIGFSADRMMVYILLFSNINM
jgi:hypothetical protein